MTVLSVTPAKLHLYTVELDDGTVGTIDKTVWEHSGYKESSSLDEATWDALCELSQTHRAHEKALYYLSLRDHGKGELIQKLQRAGIGRELATQTVERLSESGLIDDTRFAAMTARDMSERKLYPKRRIVLALREKGFDTEAIEHALSQISQQDEQQALELLYKKRYNGQNGYSAREKALAMLARYGFSYGVSKRALELWEEQQYDDDCG